MNAHINGLTNRRAPIIALIALSAAALLLGGCNDQKKKDALTIAQLQEDNQSLVTENERLSNEAKAAAERAAAAEAEAATLKSAPPVTGSASGGSGGDRILTIAGDVAFGPGQITLTSAGKAEVDKIIRTIKSQYSGSRIEVAGFTDSDPLKKTKDKYTDNENLSVQRALAVERYMNSKGIPGDLTHSSGYGPSNAKGSKKDSRRVEIRILAN
ncbi:MAG: OmpA family protein [Phycisphaerae bacterium]|nr:OmpA family protein [Phycisphaerae bacterium]